MKSLFCLLFAILILLLMGFIWPQVRHLFPDLPGLVFIITAIMLGNWFGSVITDKV